MERYRSEEKTALWANAQQVKAERKVRGRTSGEERELERGRLKGRHNA